MAKAKIDLLKDTAEEKKLKLESFDKASFLKENPGLGELTLEDILSEIVEPGRDIREEAKEEELNDLVKEIEDIKVGMILQGRVRNIMDFGMFVDINVHVDGLVHISEIAKQYVKDISSLYSIGDSVKVKVIGVDVAKRRISLSIKQVQ